MFHVPDKYRVRTGRMKSDESYGNNGLFVIPHQEGLQLDVIASDGGGWEHVSVNVYGIHTKQSITPSWEEMAFVKEMFWDDTDLVVQYHPPKVKYVNIHPNVLHLWRLVKGWEDFMPMPPIYLV